jgi:hypothetical protein
MALIKRADGTFLIRQAPTQYGTIRQARGLFLVDLQRALDIAAQLRTAGVEAYASSDMGQEQDPAYKPPTKEVDLTVVWPSTWRIEVEQLGSERFIHRFLDAQNVQHSIIGKTPQEVVDKLQGSIDYDNRAYVAAITPIPEPEVVVPAAQAEELPRKILRPGSRNDRFSQEDLDELQRQRAIRERPKTPPAEIEYQRFYETAPTAETKKRMAKDEGFMAWLDKSGALALRST